MRLNHLIQQNIFCECHFSEDTHLFNAHEELKIYAKTHASCVVQNSKSIVSCLSWI